MKSLTIYVHQIHYVLVEANLNVIKVPVSIEFFRFGRNTFTVKINSVFLFYPSGKNGSVVEHVNVKVQWLENGDLMTVLCVSNFL